MDAAGTVLAAVDELGLGPADVELALDPDLPPVHADPVLLQRVLVNVLANAHRHAPDGTPRHRLHQHPRRSRRDPGDRPRRRRRARAAGPHLPAVPALRRHRQHHRPRARARPVARVRRGHGRYPDTRGHARRGPHHGHLPAAGRRASRHGGARSEAPHRRRRPADGAGAADHSRRPRIRGRGGRRRRSRDRRSRSDPPRPHHARPRHAPARRHRGDPGAAWMDERADHRGVRSHRIRRQGRSARRRRRRLRHQALPGRRTAGAAAGALPPLGAGERRVDGGLRGSPGRPRHQDRHPGRHTCAPDPDRVAHARAPLPASGRPGHPPRPAERDLGQRAGLRLGYLRLYMSQLRKKLEKEPGTPVHLLTEAGMGYRLVL
jgi:hypothetical protein